MAKLKLPKDFLGTVKALLQTPPPPKRQAGKKKAAKSGGKRRAGKARKG